MKAIDLVNYGADKLRQRKIRTYKLDAEILLSKVLKKTRERILVEFDQKIDKIQISHYNNLIFRRLSHEPIAYLVKEKEFWSKKFIIDSNTLIPRPETELMVEKLVKINKNKSLMMLDIGTGSGCILLSLLSEIKNSKGVGIDISKKAINIAKKNAERHKILRRAKFLKKSFDNYFQQKFDLIVANLPYIPSYNIKNLDEDVRKYEPKLALDGGKDGLDLIRKVIYKAKEILKIKGLLGLEIGNGQYKKVSKLLTENKFRIEHKLFDYKDNIRCLVSRFNN